MAGTVVCKNIRSFVSSKIIYFFSDEGDYIHPWESLMQNAEFAVIRKAKKDGECDKNGEVVKITKDPNGSDLWYSYPIREDSLMFVKEMPKK